MHGGPAAVPAPDPAEKFRKGADFLFGVLIAVSLERAVEGFLHIATRNWTAEVVNSVHESLPAVHPSWSLALLRLAVFGSLITNFYFGSIKFFEKTYSGLGDPTLAGFGKRFEVDVFSGLIHFALFYAWSLSVEVPGTVSFHFWGIRGSPFLLMLLAVLVYDLFWLGGRWLVTVRSKPAPWAARDRVTHGDIFDWTWKNLALAAGAILLGHFLPGRPVLVEVIAGISAMALNLCEFPGIVS